MVGVPAVDPGEEAGQGPLGCQWAPGLGNRSGRVEVRGCQGCGRDYRLGLAMGRGGVGTLPVSRRDLGVPVGRRCRVSVSWGMGTGQCRCRGVGRGSRRRCGG